MGSASLERNVLDVKSHVLPLMPFSDTSFYDVAVQCQKRSPRWRPQSLNLYFLNLGLYVSDLLENCTIFGTTIFLDWRENAPIGGNGFGTIFLKLFCHFLCFIRDF